MRFSELVEQLSQGIRAQSLTTHPILDPELQGINSVDQAEAATLSYIEGPKFARYVQTTAASALVLPLDEALQAQALERQIAWIAAPDPRLLFAQAIALFYQPYRPQPQIHPTAVIDPSVKLGTEVYIGPYVVVQAEVEIGDRVCIHPHVVIYPGVKIGDRTILHSHSTIHERSQIGIACVIHSGAVIGDEGFGFVPTAQGWFKMEQSGITVLEDGVEVGCNSTIDRPAVGETRIGKDTKIDNLVHVGHGCQVGQSCAFAGQVGLAGGVTIGNRVILAGQVGIANQAHVGDGAIVTAQSGVHSTIKAGELVSGTPAIPHKIFLRSITIFKRLPEIQQTLRNLQRHFNSSP
ncbi:MAG: UDP-3-O-(3-hydroxymyristoyl)glucosamine N-acyltransferase [Oscillatoriales cyanobacterium RM2_1_1]|nr:UDP-3-O-(3-hydroxymyristoyl)glucosamine N-acyltransferase [Oscillatoriales cyanobacterium SM2_3_0]NJO47446.1 UDP-3-O-(3-hydroxymyristoyl)glucosamine N-acyltransferase [Oscillatoriales cyanobacterium RM2_1_1]